MRKTFILIMCLAFAVSAYADDYIKITALSTDEKAKVSANDTTSGYLEDKITAGSNITITKNNAGANETLSVASTGGTSYNLDNLGGYSTTNVLEVGGLGTSGAVTGSTVSGTSVTGNSVYAVSLNLPVTSPSGGIVYQNNTRFLHSYGANNLFLGSGAGNFKTTGTGKNIGIGAGIGAALTTGQRNTFVGDGVAPLCSSGSYNTGVGELALAALTTGQFNTAVGRYTLAAITNSTDTTAVGYAALANLTSGANNVALGSYCLYGGTTLTRMTGMGYNALTAANNAADCTSVGSHSGIANTSGSRNTYIGKATGYTNATGNDNTYIGYQAGLTSLGSNNVFLGSWAGNYSLASNMLIIDNQDRTNAATEFTNAIIVGKMAATPANQQLFLNAAVYVGSLGATGTVSSSTVSGNVVRAGNVEVENTLGASRVTANTVSFNTIQIDDSKVVACPPIQFTITEPDQLAETAFLPVWTNRTRYTFNISKIECISDGIYNVKLRRGVISGTSVLDDGPLCDFGAINGYKETSTVSHSTVSSSTVIAFDAETTYTPDYIKITIVGTWS